MVETTLLQVKRLVPSIPQPCTELDVETMAAGDLLTRYR